MKVVRRIKEHDRFIKEYYWHEHYIELRKVKVDGRYVLLIQIANPDGSFSHINLKDLQGIYHDSPDNERGSGYTVYFRGAHGTVGLEFKKIDNDFVVNLFIMMN